MINLKGSISPKSISIILFGENNTINIIPNIWYISIFFVLFLFFVINPLHGQDRIELIKKQLNEMDSISPGLNENVSFTVSDISIQELIRNLANLNKLNITIAPSIQIMVTNSFSEVPAKELILFLCKQYSLQLEITGSIISISKYIEPQQPMLPYIPKIPKIKYTASTNELSLDLKNDSLYLVTKEITLQSGKNVIFTPGLQDKKVSAYIDASPFNISLNKFALANNMEVAEEDGFYVLSTKQIEVNNKSTHNKKGVRNTSNKDVIFEYTASNKDNISIVAINTSINDIIIEISNAIGVEYFIYSDLSEERTVRANNIGYTELLINLLNGSAATFKIVEGIYLIGERNIEKLRSTKVIQLKSRTVVDIISIIPSKLSEDIEIKEFPDLNSLIISGSSWAIDELQAFITDIDKVVPVILIEVMIVDSRSNFSVSTGINAGISDGPIETGGTILPGVDFTLSAASINKLIGSFEGFGWFNLGKVTPNFYLSIKALESNGLVKVRSTPKLSTLNGHEATITIGNTEYYLEETNSVIGTQNPQNIQSQHYKPVKVDFTLKINPIVSGNEQITLDILVEQSDFTARISKEAPPGNISRSFTSLIRIKNGEMVLLGGLEEKKISESSSGIPFLSRIPIIKWLFSSRIKENSFDKLNVFIRATIIY
ncbi:MAG: general secretion pathway protein GspD [Bacteroidota bacterium]